MKKTDLSLFSFETLKNLKNEIDIELTKRKSIMRKTSGKELFDFLKDNDPSGEMESLLKFNSASLLSIPMLDKHEPNGLTQYLPSLLAQDWSEIYPRNTDHGKHYVYAHLDPRQKIFFSPEDCGGKYEGRPFYIGKGIGNRAFDLKRNEGHGKILREILNDGYNSYDIVKIIFYKLSEYKALEIEAKLIYYFGISYSKKRQGWLLTSSPP